METIKVAVLRGPDQRGNQKALLAIVPIVVKDPNKFNAAHSGMFIKLARDLLNKYASDVIAEPLLDPTASWIESVYYSAGRDGCTIELLSLEEGAQ